MTVCCFESNFVLTKKSATGNRAQEVTLVLHILFKQERQNKKGSGEMQRRIRGREKGIMGNEGKSDFLPHPRAWQHPCF